MWTDPRESRVILIGTMAELSEGGSRGFSVVLDGGTLEGFLVRSGGVVYAYRNSCPHTGAPLDWTPDSFLDLDGTLIQCALHGALFQIQTGLCVHGPCVNQHLTPLPVDVVDGRIFLVAEGS